MYKNIDIKKKLASFWFSQLQELICSEFEKLEKNFGKNIKQKPKKFIKKSWKKGKYNGGGTYKILKNGLLFDSVGVNFSKVSGKFQKKFRSQILGAKKNPNYWASGISVVAHMKNPNIPAMHFNTRFITTSRQWFGGGIGEEFVKLLQIHIRTNLLMNFFQLVLIFQFEQTQQGTILTNRTRQSTHGTIGLHEHCNG